MLYALKAIQHVRSTGLDMSSLPLSLSLSVSLLLSLVLSSVILPPSLLFLHVMPNCLSLLRCLYLSHWNFFSIQDAPPQQLHTLFPRSTDPEVLEILVSAGTHLQRTESHVMHCMPSHMMRVSLVLLVILHRGSTVVSLPPPSLS